MSIFPMIDGTLFDDDSQQTGTAELDLYREVAWNYNCNIPELVDGDFKIIEGLEAIGVWVWKALHTKRFYYPIYSFDYGSELATLIGQSNYPELVKNDLDRFIEEALTVNPYITGVRNMTVTAIGDKLAADFTVQTVYGETEVNYNV